MLLLLAAAKQVGLRCSQGFARSTGDEVAIQAVDWFVPEHHLSMYWFVSFLRGVSPRSTDLGDWLGSA